MHSPEAGPQTDQMIAESETEKTTEGILQKVLSNVSSTPEIVLETLGLDPGNDKNSEFKSKVAEQLEWLADSRKNGIGPETVEQDVIDSVEELKFWYEQLIRTTK